MWNILARVAQADFEWRAKFFTGQQTESDFDPESGAN